MLQIIRVRFTNVDIRFILRLRGQKDYQRKYWPEKVDFRYILVSKPISVLLTQISRNGRHFPFSFFKSESEALIKTIEFV